MTHRREEVRGINFLDLRGLYRSVISRCINIIAMDEGELDETGHHVMSEELISAMDTFGMINGESPLLEKLWLDEWQKVALEKLSKILASLSELDREVTEHFRRR